MFKGSLSVQVKPGLLLAERLHISLKINGGFLHNCCVHMFKWGLVPSGQYVPSSTVVERDDMEHTQQHYIKERGRQNQSFIGGHSEYVNLGSNEKCPRLAQFLLRNHRH